MGTENACRSSCIVCITVGLFNPYWNVSANASNSNNFVATSSAILEFQHANRWKQIHTAKRIVAVCNFSLRTIHNKVKNEKFEF
jgi:hypothetical protein